MANRRKEHLSRPRDDNRRDRQATVIGSDGQPVGPSLFELTGRPAKSWPAVARWFDAWRRSPMARLFTEVEWVSLGRCAFMLELFYDPDTKPGDRVRIFSGIRQTEASLGATPADRVKAGMKVKPPELASVPIAPVIDYRTMLNRASDD